MTDKHKAYLIVILLTIVAILWQVQYIMDDKRGKEAPISTLSSEVGGNSLPPLSLMLPPATFNDLLDAIEFVESGGDAGAMGDWIGIPCDEEIVGCLVAHGEYRAIGAYQIHKIYVRDCNQIASGNSSWASDNRYTYDDRWNRDKSREMTWLYIDYYSKKVINSDPALLNCCPQIKWFEIMARIHQGGPQGYKKKSTKPYWAKVKTRLEKK